MEELETSGKDQNELKLLVHNFRVSELQLLLAFAGRNKNGRKTELLHRAMDMVNNGCPAAVTFKIRQLSRHRRQLQPASELVECIDKQLNSASTSSSTTIDELMMTCSTASCGGVNAATPTSSNLHTSTATLHSVSSSVASGLTSTVIDCVTATEVLYSAAETPLYPDVHMKSLPFYDVIDTLLRPSSLAAAARKCETENYHNSSFSFCLTPRQASHIIGSQSDLLGVDCGIVEYGVQIQLRFCLSETTSDQADVFPPNLSVHVNQQELQLPHLIPSNKIGVEPRRPSRPLDITSLSKLSAIVQNNVAVYWSIDSTHNYCAGIYLVRQLTTTDLLRRLKQNGVRHPDHTTALIKEKLSANMDSEISATSLRISLLCPLSKQRMVIPCRPSSCCHLQCFDAQTFLQMNEKKPTWICPVCNKPAEYYSLIIDGLFTEILSTCAANCNDIQFTETGQWTAVQQAVSVSSITHHGSHNDNNLAVEQIPDSMRQDDGVALIDLTESDDDIPQQFDNSDSESVCALSCRSSSPVLSQTQKRRCLTIRSSSSSSSSLSAAAAATLPVDTPSHSTDDDNTNSSNGSDIITLD